MPAFQMKPKALAVTVAMSMAQSTLAGPLDSIFFKRDPPPGLPQCAPDADLKWQPAFDYDTDSCYHEAAVGADGTLCPGLDNCYTTNTADCHDESDLDNQNIYSRARCDGSGWCAYMYGYYAEKDVALEHVCGVGAGHRNDWEHVVVWVLNDEAQYVAASAHGDYDVRAATDSSVRWDGDTHPKIVYHKDGASTHAMRYANEDDDNIENDKGVWWYGALVSYEGFPSSDVRDAMMNNDWGSAVIDFTDDRFPDTLTSAKGDFADTITMDTSVDVGSPGTPSC